MSECPKPSFFYFKFHVSFDPNSSVLSLSYLYFTSDYRREIGIPQTTEYSSYPGSLTLQFVFRLRFSVCRVALKDVRVL